MPKCTQSEFTRLSVPDKGVDSVNQLDTAIDIAIINQQDSFFNDDRIEVSP